MGSMVARSQGDSSSISSKKFRDFWVKIRVKTLFLVKFLYIWKISLFNYKKYLSATFLLPLLNFIAVSLSTSSAKKKKFRCFWVLSTRVEFSTIWQQWAPSVGWGTCGDLQTQEPMWKGVGSFWTIPTSVDHKDYAQGGQATCGICAPGLSCRVNSIPFYPNLPDQ